MSSTILYTLAAFAQCVAILLGVWAYRAQHEESVDDTQRILSEQRTSRDVVLQELKRRNESINDRLWHKYPDGYVLFGGVAGNIVSLPFYRSDLHQADWANTTIQIDKRQRMARVHIPEVTLRSRSVSGYGNTFEYSGPYSVGDPIPLRFIHVEGQPDMFFEVLDDDEKSPQWLIGFKKT